MFFFFPYSTDAPVYYWPFITVGAIVLNVLVFGLQIAYPEQMHGLTLAIGDGIHPVQWLMSFFMHGDVMHLVSNMIALWVFGIVVEGKLGPWKMLAVYLGIGVTESAITQIVMLGAEPSHALGASTVIYGLMAICLVWAPENSVFLFGFVFFFRYMNTFYFELSIKVMVGLYIALDVLGLILQGGALSSEFFHVFGAFLGLITAVSMLKTGLVDCEHWDIFSVYAGRHQMTQEERDRLDPEKKKVRKEQMNQQRKDREMLVSEFRRALHLSNTIPAVRMYEKVMKEFPDQHIPGSDLLLLTQQLVNKKYWKEAVSIMNRYLTDHTEKTVLVRLNLILAYLEMDQPYSALEIIKQVDHALLDPRQLRLFEKLKARAAKYRDDGDTYGLRN